MKFRNTFLAAIAISLLLTGSSFARTSLQDAAAPAPASATTPQDQAIHSSQTTLPEQAQGAAPLRVMVDKSLLINTTERLKRISVTDPSVAYATVITPTQILVHGRAPGEVSLLIWDELERSRSFDLRVDVDVSACAEEEHRVFPDEQISVTPSRAAIVLSGHVTTEDVAKRAGELAAAYSKNVVNVLTFGPVGAQEVLLEVKFAEVDRSALAQLGANIFSTGAANLVGTSTTGQYGGFSSQSISQTQGQSPPFTATQTISSVLNMFLFQPNIHLGAVIEALETKNLLQILSEPTLIAVNGKKSSFLAGGQFPFPIVQPGAGFTAVTISFKEFGVKLEFTPVIMPNGNIHLTVAPEVSTLDFADALTISGFTIPALSTRKAETEFELRDGQSFVIAGLIDNRVTDT
ncbi:MAG: pilus assembly protein N-terminal domain-containing protein, partial [Candidatus Sulfotelmatobacter sp.]